jgi:hypothetical protein
VKRDFDLSQIGNSYRGTSWRLITTVSGGTGQAYRRGLSPGVDYRYVNLGTLINRPHRGWAGCG